MPDITVKTSKKVIPERHKVKRYRVDEQEESWFYAERPSPFVYESLV